MNDTPVSQLAEQWQKTIACFRARLSETPSLKEFNDCVDRQHMTALAVGHGVFTGDSSRRAATGFRKPAQYQKLASSRLIEKLQSELGPFLKSANIQFSPECFGKVDEGRFDLAGFLAIWSLTMEVATSVNGRSDVKTNIEMSIGCFPNRVELEIGSDCKSFEQNQILTSPAFAFACQLMPVSETVQLKCPLGGAAIQINVPVVKSLSRTRSA